MSGGVMRISQFAEATGEEATGEEAVKVAAAVIETGGDQDVGERFSGVRRKRAGLKLRRCEEKAV